MLAFTPVVHCACAHVVAHSSRLPSSLTNPMSYSVPMSINSWCMQLHTTPREQDLMFAPASYHLVQPSVRQGSSLHTVYDLHSNPVPCPLIKTLALEDRLCTRSRQSFFSCTRIRSENQDGLGLIRWRKKRWLVNTYLLLRRLHLPVQLSVSGGFRSCSQILPPLSRNERVCSAELDQRGRSARQ